MINTLTLKKPSSLSRLLLQSSLLVSHITLIQTWFLPQFGLVRCGSPHGWIASRLTLMLNSTWARGIETRVLFAEILKGMWYRGVISGFTSRLFARNVLTVEALALRDAISQVVNLCISCVIFESDCMDLIEMCRGNIVRREIEHCEGYSES